MTKEAARKIVPPTLKTLTVLLLVFGMTIATVSQGFSEQLSPRMSALMYDLYMWFEHYFRAVTVLIGAFLTYALIKASRKSGAGPQKRNLRRNSLISLSVASVLFLILFPLISGYYELYNVLMPFPWSTIPFQLTDSGTFFGGHVKDFHGIDGAAFMLYGYILYQILIFSGTIILGRRWQCSMLCMMNGCHAESLGEALPFIVHNKKKPASKRINVKVRWVLRKLQIVLLTANLVLMAGWVLILTIEPLFLERSTLIAAERLKYISIELTLLMLLWIFIGGRGYCFYCPAGFALGIVGNLVGQKIETGLTECIGCGACDDACKLSIDISAKAKENKPVKALQCVGCGLCVEACPMGNLRYSTHILRLGRSRQARAGKSV